MNLETGTTLPDMTEADSGSEEAPSEFLKEIGERLRILREDVRRLSPEELSRKTKPKGAKKPKISPSYIRRIERAQNAVTIETLRMLLTALDTNLGVFFEFMIPATGVVAASDRKWIRILQRALDGPNRKHVEGTLRLIEEANVRAQATAKNNNNNNQKTQAPKPSEG